MDEMNVLSNPIINNPRPLVQRLQAVISTRENFMRLVPLMPIIMGTRLLTAVSKRPAIIENAPYLAINASPFCILSILFAANLVL